MVYKINMFRKVILDNYLNGQILKYRLSFIQINIYKNKNKHPRGSSSSLFYFRKQSRNTINIFSNGFLNFFVPIRIVHYILDVIYYIFDIICSGLHFVRRLHKQIKSISERKSVQMIIKGLKQRSSHIFFL